MGIDLYWDNDDQTVMLAEFNGKWTWDDLHAMLGTIKRISEERGRVFGAIVDVSSGLQIPGGSIFNQEALNQFRKMLTLDQGGNKGPVVIYGMNAMVRNIFEAVSRFDKSVVEDVQFAKTLDEARSHIYKVMQKYEVGTA